MIKTFYPFALLLATPLVPIHAEVPATESCEEDADKGAKSSEAPLAVEPKKEVPLHIRHYLNFMDGKEEVFGPFGKWKQSEIELVTNPEQIQKIENQARLRLLSKGHSDQEAEHWSAIGIVAQDNYWTWVRDAVVFPSGVYGTYDRLMWNAPGVAVLPILSTKKMIVNIAYRHATRSWEVELPRGQSKEGESHEKTAERELKEETGYRVAKCTYLGTMAPDAGTMMTLLPLYGAEVNHSGETEKEYSEAIAQNPAYSKEELKQAFARGYIEISIKGERVKAYCRDPLLAYALLQAETKGLL